ncbi:hypothetical protein GCM10027267_28520 [Paramicrobacterium agarici]
MDDVDLGIREHPLIVAVTHVDSIAVADFVELRLGALAYRVHLRIWVALVYRNELRPKLEPNDTDLEDGV